MKMCIVIEFRNNLWVKTTSGPFCRHISNEIRTWIGNVLANSHLTHWGRVTHICVNKLTTIGSDNGLSPGRRQAIIWTNVGILLIRTLGTNFSEISSEIHAFSFKKNAFENVVCEMASILSRPQSFKVRAWMSNYIPYISPCPHISACLARIC